MYVLQKATRPSTLQYSTGT